MRCPLDLRGRNFGNANMGVSSQWPETARGSLGMFLSPRLNGVGEGGVQHPDPGRGPAPFPRFLQQRRFTGEVAQCRTTMAVRLLPLEHVWPEHEGPTPGRQGPEQGGGGQGRVETRS